MLMQWITITIYRILGSKWPSLLNTTSNKFQYAYNEYLSLGNGREKNFGNIAQTLQFNSTLFIWQFANNHFPMRWTFVKFCWRIFSWYYYYYYYYVPVHISDFLKIFRKTCNVPLKLGDDLNAINVMVICLFISIQMLSVDFVSNFPWNSYFRIKLPMNRLFFSSTMNVYLIFFYFFIFLFIRIPFIWPKSWFHNTCSEVIIIYGFYVC